MSEPPRTTSPDDEGRPTVASSLSPESAAKDSLTGTAPSFRSPLEATRISTTQPVAFPNAGEQIGDFELVRLLGEGAFARVFLARQVSLERMVALKVSARRGNEARTLAKLEHDHIVQVFQQSVDEARDLLLLCMQYVAGTTLERVRVALTEHPRENWSGQLILEIVDSQSSQREIFDPAALHDREFLAGCDYFEAVCWLGSRLAEALAYAHKQGVLHRDIKPANILVNAYGRPLLVDFNIAGATRRGTNAGELFGGTLAYMAPEHLDAFNPDHATARDAVDPRSDIYSLGVVLYELLTGETFHASRGEDERATGYLKRLAEVRRLYSRHPRERDALIPEAIDRVVRRCLEPEPTRRYQSAAELARALEGCLQLRRIEREMPSAGLLGSAARKHPLALTWLCMLLPHVLASAVNIPYNALRIVSELSDEQQSAFHQAVFWYNIVVYPVCIGIIYFTMMPVMTVLGRLRRMEDVPEVAVADTRRRALNLPFRALLWSCLGWLPGSLLFPAYIDLASGPIESHVYLRFFVSFAISGLIALTYSVLGLQFVVLRVFYPQFWTDGQGIDELAPVELRKVERRLHIYQLLAGLIPLLAALMMVEAGPEDFSHRAYQNFRVLLTAMILLGTIGFGVALLMGSWLGKTLQVLVQRRPRRAAALSTESGLRLSEPRRSEHGAAFTQRGD